LVVAARDADATRLRARRGDRIARARNAMCAFFDVFAS
jgi:hypothetical protein